MDDQGAREIREFAHAHPDVTQLELSIRFGVSRTTVGKILRCETHQNGCDEPWELPA